MKSIATFSASLPAILLCVAASALAASPTSITVGTAPKFLAVNQTTNRIYVSNLISGNVSVIDGATNAVVATVAVGSTPEAIAVNPATNTVYVANLLGNSVSVIDGSTNTVAATITGLSSPYGVVVNPAANQVFVSNGVAAGSVSVIDGETNTILTTIAVGNTPAGLSINSTGGRVYVANYGAGNISVIDTSSDTVTDTFTLPQSAYPLNVALDPIKGDLFVTDAANLVVDVLNASTGNLVKTITGGRKPFESPAYAAILLPGKTALLSDDGLSVVAPVNESTYAVGPALIGGNGSYGIAVNRSTGKIYVAESANGTVMVYTQ